MCSLRIMRGFSLVEVVFVLAILGIVVAIAIPGFERYMERSRIVEATTAITEMQKTIRDQERTAGKLPDALGDVGFGTRTDPWGRQYEYFNLRTSKGNGKARKDKSLKPLNSDFDLYSVGPDGDSAASVSSKVSRDDVLRARDGRFVGTATEFDP
jgi:general secretion pathway protein G